MQLRRNLSIASASPNITYCLVSTWRLRRQSIPALYHKRIPYWGADGSASGGIETAAITQIHALSAQGLAGSPAIDTGVISQIHALVAQDVAATPSIATAAVTLGASPLDSGYFGLFNKSPRLGFANRAAAGF
jgi:hypothetical protein